MSNFVQCVCSYILKFMLICIGLGWSRFSILAHSMGKLELWNVSCIPVVCTLYVYV